MSWIVEFYRSSIGRKMAMAVSGLALFGFVLMHMVGNLKVYLGAEAFNHYAEGLRTMGAPIFGHGQLLWIARIGLLLAVVVHIHAAVMTSRISHAARPTSYKRRRSVQQTYAERTMRWGGIIILLFILYHLAHFTFGPSWAHPDFIKGDPYHNFVVGFSVWWVSAFYIVAQLCLGMHLYHGLWSLFQSLGISP
ncbi:MAG: succinate dehydrogenase cytochrome b subunit, partial [Thermoanaerobaculia bacterium]|nr:succinate dehydrogenase cytochrome b subunit [Thermoanaerobaculia bacterium]